MTIVGIIIALAGVGGIVYGISENNNYVSQLESIFSKGQTNPGTTFIIVGVVLLVIGIALLLYSMKKK